MPKERLTSSKIKKRGRKSTVNLDSAWERPSKKRKWGTNSGVPIELKTRTKGGAWSLGLGKKETREPGKGQKKS